jgi:hypothetical protein
MILLRSAAKEEEGEGTRSSILVRSPPPSLLRSRGYASPCHLEKQEEMRVIVIMEEEEEEEG